MKRFLLSVIMLGSVLILRAQNGYWEEAKGPYGGRVAVVPTHTNVVYAHHAFSDNRSDDYGEHWERIFITEVDSTDYGEEELIIGAAGNFYKIVSYFDGNSSIVRKLFISNDEGQSWVVKNNDLPFYRVLEASSGILLGLDPPNGKIFRSSNSGATWQVVYNSFFPLIFGSSYISAAPNGKILLSSYVSNEFLYSENDGLTWLEGETPSVFSHSYLASSGTILVVEELGEPLSDLYRSADAGSTWDTTTFNLGPNGYLNNIVNLNNGNLLLSSGSNLFTSDNDGITWNPLPVSAEQAYGFSINFALPNGDIIGVHKEALVRSSDGGTNWSFSAFGMQHAAVKALKITSESVQFAVTDAGLWKTVDDGETWNRLLLDTSTVFLYNTHPLALINEDSFIVSMGKNIWASVVGGQSFGNLTPSGELSRGPVFAASNGQLFCTSSGGVMRMDGFGGGWSISISDAALDNFEDHPSGDLYAMTSPLDYSSQNKKLWHSDDAGETWEEVNTLSISPVSRMNLHIDKNGKLYVTGYYDHANKVAISEDGGLSWVYKTIPNIYSTGEIVANSLGQIFTTVHLQEPSVLTSADQGDSWYYLPSFLDNSGTFNDLVLSPDGRLYVNGNEIMSRSRTSTEQGAYIRGQVSKDADVDCSTLDAQEPVKNWVVKLDGENTYYNSTNEYGKYTFFVDTGLYTVTTLAPQNLWWSLCDSVQEIDAKELLNVDTANFVALALADCPLMTVNVGIPQLRRCFDNEIYLEYCNQGTEPADSAWVDILLDPYLSFVSSAQPHEILGVNFIRFLLGDVSSGDCGQFQLTIYVDCDSTILGQTHCITAHGFPDTLCTTVPNWSGANIEATVSCQDSTLQFNLKNTGSAHSQTLDYIIIEDDVVLMTGQQDYDIAEDLVLNVAANGSTWRIESEQEPGHPFSNLALAFAEGCGGFNSLGYINQFTVNGIQPSWHRMCVENTGSYDPNDKQGFPIGVGSEHNIRPGQTIDYLIRFQNTGTDTAFTVLIRDTLSTFLDPINIRPGASSHPYTWDLSGQGVIQFIFNNILLPDSNVNEATSHGFVQFSIAPYVDVPLGSVIQNNAAIYFDFNLPVITNTTWHTIEKSPLISATHPVPSIVESELEVWPNPFSERTNIHVQKATRGKLTLNVFNSLGNLVVQKAVIGPDIELNTKNLPKGLYWAEIRNLQGEIVGSVKLLRQ